MYTSHFQKQTKKASEDRIKKALHDSGPLSAKELMKLTELSHETIRKRTKELQDSGVITEYLDGRKKLYSLTEEGMVAYERRVWPIVEDIIHLRNNGGSYFRIHGKEGFTEDVIFDVEARFNNLFQFLPPDGEFYRWFLTHVASEYFKGRTVDTPVEEGRYMRILSIDFKQLRMHLKEIQYIVSKQEGDYFNDPQLKLIRARDPQELRNYIMHYLDIFNVASRLILNGQIVLHTSEQENGDQKKSLKILRDKYNKFITEIGKQGKKLYSDLDEDSLNMIRTTVESGKNPFLDEKLNTKMRPSKKLGKYGLMDELLLEYITVLRLLDLKNDELLEKLNKFYFEARNRA